MSFSENNKKAKSYKQDLAFSLDPKHTTNYIGNNKIYLTTIGDNNAYLSDVDLLENAIRIHYKITGTGGTLNAKVEWRVK